MHFLLQETLSFNLIYVAACYLVGTGMCHNMVGLLQHYAVHSVLGFCILIQFATNRRFTIFIKYQQRIFLIVNLGY